jgi:hypothetical protein
MSFSTTLTSLGGDLTLSISWAVANELLAAAKDAELSESELIGAVLCLSIVLSGLPGLLSILLNESASTLRLVVAGATPAIADPPNAQPPTTKRGVLAFFELFVRVAQRISVSICVQLIATSVHAQQPIRSVRVITLLGVAVFFVFLESTSSLGRFA